jgi:hypothetical protein
MFLAISESISSLYPSDMRSAAEAIAVHDDETDLRSPGPRPQPQGSERGVMRQLRGLAFLESIRFSSPADRPFVSVCAGLTLLTRIIPFGGGVGFAPLAQTSPLTTSLSLLFFFSILGFLDVLFFIGNRARLCIKIRLASLTWQFLFEGFPAASSLPSRMSPLSPPHYE